MSVDTKTVSGRRELRFESYEQLLTDAEMLASSEVKMVGNWSLGQVFQHLAIAFSGSIDGIPFQVPLPIKIIARLFMKKKFLYGKLPSGFAIPDKQKSHFVASDTTTTSDGLIALRRAVHRLQAESARVPHPAFGKLNRKEWDQWHFRHAELHLSFATI